jgi:hypothetical protein
MYKIKVALAHPAASNGVCSRQRSGLGVLKIEYFHLLICFFFLLGFPDFEHSFELHQKLFRLLQFLRNLHHSRIHHPITVF